MDIEPRPHNLFSVMDVRAQVCTRSIQENERSHDGWRCRYAGIVSVSWSRAITRGKAGFNGIKALLYHTWLCIKLAQRHYLRSADGTYTMRVAFTSYNDTPTVVETPQSIINGHKVQWTVTTYLGLLNAYIVYLFFYGDANSCVEKNYLSTIWATRAVLRATRALPGFARAWLRACSVVLISSAKN